MTEEEIIGAITKRIRTNKAYKEDLETAIEKEDESTIFKLIADVIGFVIDVADAILDAIISIFDDDND